MRTQVEQLESDVLDDHAVAIYLEVPGSKIVLLQGLFELYEDLAVVRTLSVMKSLVCLITTKSKLADCHKALEAIQPMVRWRPVARPSAEDRELYLGYTKKAKKS